jgi:hypothetical protein
VEMLVFWRAGRLPIMVRNYDPIFFGSLGTMYHVSCRTRRCCDGCTQCMICFYLALYLIHSPFGSISVQT